MTRHEKTIAEVECELEKSILTLQKQAELIESQKLKITDLQTKIANQQLKHQSSQEQPHSLLAIEPEPLKSSRFYQVSLATKIANLTSDKDSLQTQVKSLRQSITKLTCQSN